jgi:hypothetical protein
MNKHLKKLLRGTVLLITLIIQATGCRTPKTKFLLALLLVAKFRLSSSTALQRMRNYIKEILLEEGSLYEGEHTLLTVI